MGTQKDFFARICGSILFVNFIFFCAQVADAQNELPPDVKDEINTIIENAVNGVTVFSSQPTVSSGYFTIKNNEDPDSHFEVLRVPVEVNLTEKGTFTPFVNGLLGYFKVVETFLPVEGEGENDFSSIKTWSVGAGGGVKIEPFEWLQITPAFSAIYSHTENEYDYNNQFSQEVLQPYGKQLFNWDVETMTYVPSIRGDVRLELGGAALLLWSKYTYLYNDSFSSDSSTIDISADTELWQNSIGTLIPIGVEISSCPLSVKTAITRTDIYGSGRDGLEFDHFYEIGVDLLADTKGRSTMLSSISVGGSYMFGDDVDGWRVGVGYEF